MLVQDIMDKDLTSIAQETTLLEAIALLAAHKTSGLPVVNDDGKVVGFLSEKDILRAVIPGYLGYMDDNFAMPDIEKVKARIERVGRDPARDYMNKDVAVFDEKETIPNAMVTLFKRDISRAPVVREGCLIGTVDREEILKGFVQENFQAGEVEIPVGGGL